MKYFFLFFSSLLFAQQTQFVDFKSVTAQLQLNANTKSITGNVAYECEVLQPVDTIKIDAKTMRFTQVKWDGKELPYVANKEQLLLIAEFKKGKHTLQFSYEAQPKQALYFVGTAGTDGFQIWTQGQGKYTSHWFPSFDDVNEKVIFNLDITFDSNYQVLSNGILKEKSVANRVVVWKYRMQKPMSSYLLMMAIGKFEKKEGHSAAGTPLEWYLEPKNKDRFESTYRYSVSIFDFLEKEIGVKYPWKIYKQVPVRDFLYAGMENTTATTFLTRYVVDSIGFYDRKYTNVNAHELAHQWFGNMITAKSSQHHWLQEGFATYFALLAEREIYGDDFFYSYLHEKAQQLKFASRTDTIPVLNAKASSLTFYEKGAWALFVLHQKIGDVAFKKGLKNYLKKYAFQTVTTADFLQEIEKVADFDTKTFSKVWLEDYRFNSIEANELLVKNKSSKIQLEVDELRNKPLSEKKIMFREILESEVYFSVKESILTQLQKESYADIRDLIAIAFTANNRSLRQKIAYLFPKVPEEFKFEYETLLNEASYQTQEIALFHLWNTFENDRARYLNQTKNWIGFNDYNLRILWLGLALNTKDYSATPKVLIQELISYSSTEFEASTRQNALETLLGFQLITPEVLKNLVNATTHHMWQFSKFGRTAIRKLLKDPVQRTNLEQLLPQLNESEKLQLARLLAE
ncbi:M1 family metallopeptidase [Flavobacterium sp. TSSA_36]|uniref:M1 family metallopeptidase n=1 Tax=Flavobacterium sp. TSSA_36 TaxID=3447669 RepID=UPI003F315A8C